MTVARVSLCCERCGRWDFWPLIVWKPSNVQPDPEVRALCECGWANIVLGDFNPAEPT